MSRVAVKRSQITFHADYSSCNDSGQVIYAHNCNCNWGTCIAPPTRRPRAHHSVNPYPDARRQNDTEMFSDHDETKRDVHVVKHYQYNVALTEQNWHSWYNDHRSSVTLASSLVLQVERCTRWWPTRYTALRPEWVKCLCPGGAWHMWDDTLTVIWWMEVFGFCLSDPVFTIIPCSTAAQVT